MVCTRSSFRLFFLALYLPHGLDEDWGGSGTTWGRRPTLSSRQQCLHSRTLGFFSSLHRAPCVVNKHFFSTIDRYKNYQYTTWISFADKTSALCGAIATKQYDSWNSQSDQGIWIDSGGMAIGLSPSTWPPATQRQVCPLSSLHHDRSSLYSIVVYLRGCLVL